MKYFQNLSLKIKLIAAMMALVLIPIFIVTVTWSTTTSNAIMEDNIEKFERVVLSCSTRIMDKFNRQFNVLDVAASSKNLRSLVSSISDYHDRKNVGAKNIDATDIEFTRRLRTESEFMNNLLKQSGMVDIMLMCSEHGHIIYSASNDKELGLNFSNSELRNTNLFSLWQKIIKTGKNSLVDFRHYKFTNEPAAFLGVPVRDADGKLIAVLCAEIDHDKITEIVQVKETDAETEEIYLVGEDYLMRSDSRFFKESTVLKNKVENEAVKDALDGNTGSKIIKDYRGVPVLSVYRLISLKDNPNFGADFNWAVMAEIDEDEVLAVIDEKIYTDIVMSVIIAFIILFITFLFANNITKPIIYLAGISEEIGDGNLSVNVEETTRSDEIGRLYSSFSRMTKKLKSQIGEIVEGSNVLMAATSQIVTTVSELTVSANQTVSAVNETSTTVDEVKQTAILAKELSDEVTVNSKKSLTDSRDGETAVKEMFDKITNIKDQMNIIAGSINELSEQSATIGEIMNTINDLAEQSNLLAVNAAIEAAKAGEKGKGFAVVANEVRSLAEQSKQATQTVRAILNEVQKATSKAVLSTEQGGRTVDEGVERVNVALDKIKFLAKSIDEASQSAIQIGASSQQQFVGVDQINIAVKSISEASQQNLSSSGQLKQAAEDLKTLAENLKKVVEYYR